MSPMPQPGAVASLVSLRRLSRPATRSAAAAAVRLIASAGLAMRMVMMATRLGVTVVVAQVSRGVRRIECMVPIMPHISVALTSWLHGATLCGRLPTSSSARNFQIVSFWQSVFIGRFLGWLWRTI